jgi:hypothetical protein
LKHAAVNRNAPRRWNRNRRGRNSGVVRERRKGGTEMAQPSPYGYYYGNEADQYTFYRLPKALFTNSRYKGLSDGAKILYGLMFDRMGLSMKNGWLDEQNRVYIYFTLEDVQEYMNCQRDKGMKLLAELDTAKGVGLIERVKQGLGKPTIIYVRKFFEGTDLQTSEKPTSGLPDLPTSAHRHIRPLDYGKMLLSSRNP